MINREIYAAVIRELVALGNGKNYTLHYMIGNFYPQMAAWKIEWFIPVMMSGNQPLCRYYGEKFIPLISATTWKYVLPNRKVVARIMCKKNDNCNDIYVKWLVRLCNVAKFSYRVDVRPDIVAAAKLLCL